MSTSASMQKEGGSDGFWSVIGKGVSSGLSRVGSELLPIWAANSIQKQSKNQTADPTYNSDAPDAVRRLPDGMESSSATGLFGGGSEMQKNFLFIVLPTVLLILAAIFFSRK